jgi:gamma-glutamylcyclotransferase
MPLYFAYGLNMLTSRMQNRIPLSVCSGISQLADHLVVCNKESAKGDAKANLETHPGSTVWGVLYALSHNDLTNLDRYEKGYLRKTVSVICNPESFTAETYISTNISNQLANEKYVAYIIEGAKEHQLPATYIDYLSTFMA